MKKFIILSFMFLFFAGISNNANAQKDKPQTKIIITYVWHCIKNPNANLYVVLEGNTQDHGWKRIQKAGVVGSSPTKTVSSGYRYTGVTVDACVRANFAWAQETVTKTNPDPTIDYIENVYVTLHIYDGPQAVPGSE